MKHKRWSGAVLVAAISMACAPGVFAQGVRTVNAPYPIAIEKREEQKLPLAVPVRAAEGFVLLTDQPIHEGLQEWARNAGWVLYWYPSVSWKTLRQADFNRPRDLTSYRDVTSAVSEVIDILRDEGKPLRLKISDGNKVMEVISNEVRND